jgi:hypothetical protein
MKNIIMALVASAIVVFNATAQDIIDPPRLFNSSTETMIQSQTTSFVKGWNWGFTGRLLDEAMKMTYYHNLPITDVNSDYIDNTKAVQPLYLRVGDVDFHIIGRNQNLILNGNALYLEPTLVVDSTD